jgi:hypothetical protein
MIRPADQDKTKQDIRQAVRETHKTKTNDKTKIKRQDNTKQHKTGPRDE